MVSPAGALGSFLWASPPVAIRPKPPRRPTIANIQSNGSLFTVRWNQSSDPVSSYCVYGSVDPEAAQDIRSMELLAETEGTSASVLALPGSRMWFRVAALTTYDPPVGTLISAPSDAASAIAPTYGPPTAPQPSAITTNVTSSSVSLQFAADGNPTTVYMLCRVSPSGAMFPVAPWQPSTGPGAQVSLVDAAPTPGPMNYVIRCANETQLVSVTAVIAVNVPEDGS